MATATKRYTPAFKRQVLDAARTGGKSKAAIAGEFGISQETLRGWMKNSRGTTSARPTARTGTTGGSVGMRPLLAGVDLVQQIHASQPDHLDKALGLLFEIRGRYPG